MKKRKMELSEAEALTKIKQAFYAIEVHCVHTAVLTKLVQKGIVGPELLIEMTDLAKRLEAERYGK